MSQVIQFDQAAACIIKVEHDVDGIPLSGITDAKYEIYNATGVAILTKLFGTGVTFEGGEIVISMTEDETETLTGSYDHCCVVRDSSGKRLFPLKGKIRFDRTRPRV